MKKLLYLGLMGVMVLTCSIQTLVFDAVPVLAVPQLPGNVFATNSTGTVVNGNIYTAKTDVYIRGQQLPANTSFDLEVTIPSGNTVLGTSLTRVITQPVTTDASGNFGPIQIWANVNKTSDNSTGYDDTTNSGHEYKVLISTDSTFPNSLTKSDNFKVLKSSTTSTLLSATTILLGQSITDNATVSGTGGTATGNVTFQVGTDGVNFSPFGTQKTLSGGSATSDFYTPGAAGTYYFRAIYTGDTNYYASQSGNLTEPLVVNTTVNILATSFTVTQLSPTTITLGQSVTDFATVSGSGPVPMGNVTFQVGTDGVNFNNFGVQKMLSSDTATSDAYTPLSAGIYYFRAFYIGDANYQSSYSDNLSEPLVVNSLAASTTITHLSASSINFGQSVTDNVSVTGNGPVPAGNVTFQVGTNGVNFSPFGTQKTIISGNATSDTYTPPSAGTYYFRAVYVGDAFYNTSQSGNREEILTVNKLSSRTTTDLSGTLIVQSQSVTDKAIVTGSNGIPTGNVTFQVSTDGANFTNFGMQKPLIGGFAISDNYTPTAAGTYYFRAVYLGNTNYNTSQSGNKDEKLVVKPTCDGATITRIGLSATSIPTNMFVTIMGQVIVGANQIPMGTLTYQVSTDGAKTWTDIVTPKMVVFGYSMTTYIPKTAGTYYFRAIFNPAPGFTSSQSGDTSAKLTVYSVK